MVYSIRKTTAFAKDLAIISQVFLMYSFYFPVPGPPPRIVDERIDLEPPDFL
jgi:hypothetical protein